jgi:adenylate kinase family enzyme
MRVLIFGNSGSGKSVLARRLAAENGLAHLDLDNIVWEPGQVAVPRSARDVNADLRAFIAGHDLWVVEGCYGELVETAAAHCTELVFLNPGLTVCLANCLRRPWEPHKYASKTAQDAMLPTLLDWVRGDYLRDDAWSYARHRRLFDAFAGNKRELTAPPG